MRLLVVLENNNMIYVKNTLIELKEENTKSIYCIGAGKVFDTFMKEFDRYHLEYNIKAVVDKHAEEPGFFVKEINGVSIPMILLSQMLKEIKNSDCILITTAAFEEIIQQFEKIPKLRSIRYCLYFVLRMETYDYERLQIPMPESLSTCRDYIIPKTIHYCWFGEKEMPRQHRRYIESWKQYCPDYEIIEWNEGNYDVHKSRYISEAYEHKKWAFVSDFARMDIINEYGGVYLDTDVELIKNIDEMLKNEAFCGFESKDYVAYGLGFGARRNHPIIEEIKDYYENLPFVLERGQINEVTCPVIQTEVMKRHGLVCNGEFQVVEGMAIYPERILCGMSVISLRVEKNPMYTYAIHHYEGSWKENGDSPKQRRIAYMKRGMESKHYFYPE